MRLDRFVSFCAALPRREAILAIRRGTVAINGQVCRTPDARVREEADAVTLAGALLLYQKTVWVMLNKPQGYVSATEDGALPVVTELLPEEYRRREVFPVGRLDRDTVGLMLLTDDGETAHRLLSPRRHVEKEYRMTLSAPLPQDAVERCVAGMVLSDFVCKRAVLYPDADRMGGRILLTEGKYHQIKRMMHALGTEVRTLERTRFGGIALDKTLKRGEWRALTAEEIALLHAAAAPKEETKEN